MKFEWNNDKEKINIQKHGVTFEQASYVFADKFTLNKDEYDFTDAEQGKFYRPMEELDKKASEDWKNNLNFYELKKYEK